jgi:hypothetical protein
MSDFISGPLVQRRYLARVLPLAKLGGRAYVTQRWTIVRKLARVEVQTYPSEQRRRK